MTEGQRDPGKIQGAKWLIGQAQGRTNVTVSPGVPGLQRAA